MSQTKALISELTRESINTRKMLERISTDQFTWKPHPKNRELITLMTHIAELPDIFITKAIQSDAYDFKVSQYQPANPKSEEELLALFDQTLTQAVIALENTTDEDLQKTWTLKSGGHTIVSLPRFAIIRTLALNHIIHHRGQLSVYLRLLNIPVPGMYGPSADE